MGVLQGRLQKFTFDTRVSLTDYVFVASYIKIKYNYSAAKYGQAPEGLDRFIILNNRF